MKTLSLVELETREAMLETLQVAYRNLLDECFTAPSDRRLAEAEQFKLGQRLAVYWLFQPKLKCKPYQPSPGPAEELIQAMERLQEERGTPFDEKLENQKS